MKVAVVGHVEWIDFVRVNRLPEPGSIVTASDAWEEPAGGGAVAAVQLAELAGAAILFTALGDDVRGRLARDGLARLGVRVEAALRAPPQRRGIVFVDDAAERTITLLSEKLRPRREEPLPWHELAGVAAVYFTGGDADALRAARAARVLVATARELPTIRESRVRLDALVLSASDEGEGYQPGDLEPPPRLVVATEGSRGGTYTLEGGPARRFSAPGAPETIVDAYGAGDRFAAGLTFGLGRGLTTEDALTLAARCGADALGLRGAFGGGPVA